MGGFFGDGMGSGRGSVWTHPVGHVQKSVRRPPRLPPPAASWFPPGRQSPVGGSPGPVLRADFAASLRPCGRGACKNSVFSGSPNRICSKNVSGTPQRAPSPRPPPPASLPAVAAPSAFAPLSACAPPQRQILNTVGRQDIMLFFRTSTNTASEKNPGDGPSPGFFSDAVFVEVGQPNSGRSTVLVCV